MSNRAQPQRLLGRDRPFRLTPAALCRAGISSLRRTGSVWVWRLNGRVLGLAAAGVRSGAGAGSFRASTSGKTVRGPSGVARTCVPDSGVPRRGTGLPPLALRGPLDSHRSRRRLLPPNRRGLVQARRPCVRHASAGRVVRRWEAHPPRRPSGPDDLFRLYCASTPSRYARRPVCLSISGGHHGSGGAAAERSLCWSETADSRRGCWPFNGAGLA